MRLLYNPQDGEIFYAVYDGDWFSFVHNTRILLSELQIDEVAPDNKTLCRNLTDTVGMMDDSGKGRYYVNAQGTLMERENWVEYVPEVLSDR